jgi:hypothetical protein
MTSVVKFPINTHCIVAALQNCHKRICEVILMCFIHCAQNAVSSVEKPVVHTTATAI